jgi:exonuclease III
MLRVATLNAWGMRGDWAARLPVFQQGFRELDADIVTLQETILSEQADQAAEMLGPDYHLAQQREREQDGQGITTASRHPFGQIFEVDFHVTARTCDFACTCLVTEVLVPEPFDRVWVANHFPDISSIMNGNGACSRPRRRAGWKRWFSRYRDM